MSEPGLKDLLQAGVHFGHQTRRWNPRMRRYIHGERDGIHIIDLLQTEQLLAEARRFAAEIAAKGGSILFVGTKKQARDSIKSWAERCGMPYVNQRWLGGLLTNFHTISARIDRLHELNALKDGGQLDLLPTKERMSMEAELEKLEYNLGGVRDMKRLPQAALIIDLKSEAIAVRECERLQILILGLVDSNVDPVSVAFPIPGTTTRCAPAARHLRPSARASRTPRTPIARRRPSAARRRRSGVVEAEEKARRGRGEGAQGGRGAGAAGAAASQPAQDPGQPQQPRAHGGGLMAASITATDVKGLRDRTGAAMMDCKAALEEASSDVEKAIEILRVRARRRPPSAPARDRRGRLVSSIHAGGGKWAR